MATTQPTENAVTAALASIVGGKHVLDSPADRAHFSQDIFSFSDGPVAEVVVQPGDITELTDVLEYAAADGYAVYTRGGGMSYTHGYVPTEASSILLDLRRLNTIREVNRTEQYVVAEAGCTWTQVTEALEGTGLQLEFTAPFSGIYSTVGGAMSQNVPQGMRGVLGLEVVKMDGSLLRTGSWGTKAGRPFLADFGPNLTGLFLGDCGSFAIKTAAILKLRRQPTATDYCSFAFETYEDMASAMVSLAGMAFIRRAVGLDPYKSQNSIKVGFREALETVKAVASTQGTMAGAKFSAQATRNFMEGVKWSMHLTIDSDCAEGVAQNIEKVRAVCLTTGREIPNLLPQAMAARSFSVRGFLGPKGERWVPTNSLFPVSQAPEVATRVQAFFESHREAMNGAGMWESYMTNFGAGYFLCEPSVYWQDEVSSLHLAHLSSDEAKRFRKHAPNLAARQLAQRIRGELKGLLQSLGAMHVQLGKYYGYGDILQPAVWQQMQSLKQLFDPDYRLNPGNLGFTSNNGAKQ